MGYIPAAFKVTSVMIWEWFGVVVSICVFRGFLAKPQLGFLHYSMSTVDLKGSVLL